MKLVFKKKRHKPVIKVFFLFSQRTLTLTDEELHDNDVWVLSDHFAGKVLSVYFYELSEGKNIVFFCEMNSVTLCYMYAGNQQDFIFSFKQTFFFSEVLLL